MDQQTLSEVSHAGGNDFLSSVDAKMLDSSFMSPSAPKSTISQTSPLNRVNIMNSSPLSPPSTMRDPVAMSKLFVAEMLVNKEKMIKKLKSYANQEGLINIKSQTISTMSEGLVEYMRLCVEELIDVSRSGRNVNTLNSKNLAPGTVTHVRCSDHLTHLRCTEHHRDPQCPSRQQCHPPVEFDAICISNPR